MYIVLNNHEDVSLCFRHFTILNTKKMALEQYFQKCWRNSLNTVFQSLMTKSCSGMTYTRLNDLKGDSLNVFKF